MPAVPPQNPDPMKAVVCVPARVEHPSGDGFPVVWANHSTAPITFAVCAVLIVYFICQIILYIRSRRVRA